MKAKSLQHNIYTAFSVYNRSVNKEDRKPMQREYKDYKVLHA